MSQNEAEDDRGCSPSLLIRLLIAKEDGRNLNINNMLGMMQHKNDAVPSYSFPVPPLPSSPLERDHISAKRVGLKIVNRPPHTLLYITGKSLSLLLRSVGEFNAPAHV